MGRGAPDPVFGNRPDLESTWWLCAAWTSGDLLSNIRVKDKRLAEKIYLLQDCASPVIVPGVIDYSQQADAAFRRFVEVGMRVVHSTDPIETSPGIKSKTQR